MTSNDLVFSLAAAIGIPVAVILVGYGIHILCMALAALADAFFGSRFVYAIINYLFFPGVVLHELSHALLAVLTGAKVTKVVLFKKSGHTLGHVEFRHRGGPFLVALQNIFISSAPMFLGALVIYGCYHVIFQIPGSLLWQKLLLGYIGISMFFHMTMSLQDIKVYAKGIPLFSCVIFLTILTLQLFGVI